MSAYDNYDDGGRSDYTTRYHEERRYRDPRHGEIRESYTKTHPTSRDLVPRSREDSEYGVEEIRRDFPPPTYGRDPYRDYDDDHYSRSTHTRRDYAKMPDAYRYEDKKTRRMLSNQQKILAAVVGGALAVGGKELYDRREATKDGHDIQRNPLSSAALGAAGALAAYQGAELYSKHHSGKDGKKALVAHKGRRVDYYTDEDSDGDPRNKKGQKNFLESALAAAGLGGAVTALRGGSDHDDRRSDTRSRRGDSRSRSRSGSRAGGNASNKMQKAAMACLIAGATEAFRVAKEPGGWKGEKAKRVVTAAAGAATLDAVQSGNSKLGLAESVIGGLLGNRAMNGSRKDIEEDRRTGRSRSRSRARSSGGGGGGGGVSGLAALATAGLGALGAKKIANSRSRSRQRSPDRRTRSRSRSVVDTARRGLAKLGLGNEPDSDYDRGESSRYKTSSSRSHRRRDSVDSYDDSYSDRRRGSGRDSSRRSDYDDRGSSGRRDRRRGGGRSDSGSDLGSSSEDEKKATKMKGKQIVTTGLAAVATIHAAHNVYQSMEKRRTRQEAVREGKLSPEEARKLKQKALLQDAASIGLAALGVKGALSEMKEAREVLHEAHEWKEEKARRHQRRLERQRRSRLAASRDASGHDDDYSPGDPYATLPPSRSW